MSEPPGHPAPELAIHLVTDAAGSSRSKMATATAKPILDVPTFGPSPRLGLHL